VIFCPLVGGASFLRTKVNRSRESTLLVISVAGSSVEKFPIPTVPGRCRMDKLDEEDFV